MKPYAQHCLWIAALCCCFSPLVDGRSCAEIEDLFAKADRNADGTLTLTELQDMRDQAFARMDRNGDGFAESKDAPPAFRRRYNEQVNPLIEQFDANGDGRLSYAEFVNGPTPGFDAADIDGNDQVDEVERGANCA